MNRNYTKSTTARNVGIFAITAWLSVVVLILWGWVLNIMTLVAMDSVLDTGVGVVRLIGIFIAPLGAVMGWFVG